LTAAVFEAVQLSKDYGGGVGLSRLDLRLEPGEVFGFLGPNGAGKTTTIRLALGLIRPTHGSVKLFGRPANDPSLRQRIGYLPGELALDERLNGRRMLEFLDQLRPAGTAPCDPAFRDQLCERLRLTKADLNRPLRDDSRGTKQKIGFVAALQHQPELLVLDEPTTGMDPLVREEALQIMREAGQAGRTVFHSSHVISEVDRSCTRVAIVRAGRLVTEGRTDALRQALTRRMVVRFVGPVPVAEFHAAGAQLIEHGEHEAVLRIRGDIDPLLAVLARHRVQHLSLPEPELEEAFLNLYSDSEQPT
jgi:ABC-2 type transport system ATP-binding protein